MGASATIFSGGCSFLPKRPPYQAPDRLVSITKVLPATGEEPIRGLDILEWRSRSQTLGPIAAYSSRGLSRTDLSEPERIFCGLASDDFFPVLGVRPILGRVFRSEEHQSGRGQVAVASHSLWRRSFGGDPSVIGRTVTLNQEQYTVIGIMPPDFELPEQCEMWLPSSLDSESRSLKEKDAEPRASADLKPGITLLSDKNFGPKVIARLKPGVTLLQAQTEMDGIARDLAKKYPETNDGRGVKLTYLFR